MRNELLNLEHKIEFCQKNARNTIELYQLLSTYNSYSILMLKAKSEYESKKVGIIKNRNAEY